MLRNACRKRPGGADVPAVHDAQFPRSRRPAVGHPRRRRDVGRRRFVGHGRAAEGRGLRRRRRHPAALRPWRRDPPQGRLLRRPRHPRRPHGRRTHRHSALRARLREPLQGSGHRPLRRELLRGRDAGAVRRLQHVDQVPRPAHHRARPRRPGSGHRPLCRLAGAAGRRPRALPGARGRARPELFPVRHHARAARLPALSAGRAQQGGDARTRPPLRPVGRRQAGQPGHLLRAVRPVYRRDRAAEAGRGRTGRYRRHLRQGAGPSSRHHPFHRRPAPRPRHRGGPAALCGPARGRIAAGRRRPARSAAHLPHDACAT